MPDEERGTKVSLEGDYLEEEHLNILERFEFDIPALKIKSRFRSYEIDAHRLRPGEFEQIKKSLARQNYDGRRPLGVLPDVRKDILDGVDPSSVRGQQAKQLVFLTTQM